MHVYEPHKVGLPPLRAVRARAVAPARVRLRAGAHEAAAQHYDTVVRASRGSILNPLLLGVVYFILVDILRRGSQPAGFFAHLLAGIFAYYLVADAVRPAAQVGHLAAAG